MTRAEVDTVVTSTLSEIQALCGESVAVTPEACPQDDLGYDSLRTAETSCELSTRLEIDFNTTLQLFAPTAHDERVTVSDVVSRACEALGVDEATGGSDD